ncbi:acetyl-CoA carboxylase biotin carboxylase subunit [Micromonospora maris]|uniref:acetyl-CoA carboxylase biotin carboxylase subunit n=1 Tax=Micromonospora maris TaxID=1003110 RepID=UPI002E0DF8F7|nr:acetyl-CoA carboxylase biotin carboxylase subunit [Micromonospora maris]WSK40041.1 acetyl-CoA carboxylase biotin carboxylase subunit [Micromonospora maris]
MRFRSVLVANRGEIAVRIVRACRELGIRTVAVYSSADRDAVRDRLGDEQVHIGPAPARRSYLNAAAIIEAALQRGAEAVHPGYGFLSEDPDFAAVCAANGLTFVGPPPDVIGQFGDKAAARTAMADAGLPVLPGTGAAVEEAEARATADDLGYPVIIKAVAGGGGRGMEIVTAPEAFVAAYRRTRDSARLLFGDDRVCVERFLVAAHHVEVQILCDDHGNAVHLGLRDCSVQRRRQKLVEESPSPVVSAELAERIAAAALRGARAVGYRGAGTFEFLLDADRRDFYFIEANCRIQVEHPVTEMVTGVDLVREQLLIAAGHPLSIRQEEVRPQGVAVECRINAEDPDRNFTPSPGPLAEFVPPGGPFVRVDTHAYPGLTITPHYDPLIAKVICWGPDREVALNRMDRALAELRVAGPGVRTTTDFLRELIAHPLFRKGVHTTSLVDRVVAERQPQLTGSTT